MATAPLTLGRDSQGQINFALSTAFARKYNNQFAEDTEVSIPLETGDRFIVFFPENGGNFYISDITVPSFPSVAGGVMLEANIVQNIALLDLTNWKTDNVFIKSPLAQTFTALVYK